jgi:hypothetical protein
MQLKKRIEKCFKPKLQLIMENELFMSPRRRFEKWCSTPLTGPVADQILSKRAANSPPEKIAQVFTTIIEEIKNKQGITFNLSLDSNIYEDIEIDFTEKISAIPFDSSESQPRRTSDIASLSISSIDQAKNFLIKGAKIEKATITVKVDGEYVFEDCYFRELNFSKNGAGINAKFNNCWIAKMHLGPLAIFNLNIKSGGIYSFTCAPPDGENPFTGTVTIADVYFPTSQKATTLFPGAQQYRNLRSHFEKLNNGAAAGLMRAKELASNREHENGVTWLFSWMYYIASNYGLRPAQPLAIAFIFYLMAVGGIYSWDNGGRINKSTNKLKGWELSLKYDKCKRSFILPAQSMLNPVGAFRQNQILIPNTFGWKITLLVYGFFSDGLILFFILSLRKHFKIT